jgi:hypothetical protein
MDTVVFTRQQLIKAIDELPVEVLPELATFIDYLRFKVTPPRPSPTAETPQSSGSAFLLSIANFGAADEDDISERDEEILTNEIDPIRGWGTLDHRDFTTVG